MHLVRYFIFLPLLILSCRTGPVGYIESLLLSSSEEQSIQERIWEDVSFEKLFSLPIDSLAFLYDPGLIKSDTAGDIYVLDIPTLQVLRFAEDDGRFLTSYGNGIGTGPGEFHHIIDFGAAGDSIVFVLDDRRRRISYFTKESGDFVESSVSKTGESPLKHAVTESGIEYTLHYWSEYIFSSKTGDHIVRFGEERERGMTALVFGNITTYKNYMIYLPSFYPLILIYDADGNLIVSKHTIDYNENFELPELWRNETGAIDVDGDILHGGISVYGNELYILKIGDEWFFDVYNAEAVDYRYSFRIPSKLISYFMKNRLYQLVDLSLIHI